MHIGKSIKIAVVRTDKTYIEVAQKLGVTRNSVYRMLSQKGAQCETIERLAAIFEMKASEFIALSE